MPDCSSLRRLMLSLVLLPGCAGSAGPQQDVLTTVSVAGTLTYKGQALESFQVVFTPVKGTNRPATGLTDAEGKFTLGTNAPGDGAPPGAYNVSIAFAPPTPDDAMPIDDPALMPKPKVEVPAKYSSPETSGVTQDVPEGGLTDLKIDLQ